MVRIDKLFTRQRSSIQKRALAASDNIGERGSRWISLQSACIGSHSQKGSFARAKEEASRGEQNRPSSTRHIDRVTSKTPSTRVQLKSFSCLVRHPVPVRGQDGELALTIRSQYTRSHILHNSFTIRRQRDIADTGLYIRSCQ